MATNSLPDKTLEEILRGNSFIPAEKLSVALKEQKKNHQPLGKVLVKLGIVKEMNLLQFISKQIHVPFLSHLSKEIAPEIVSEVPAKFASHYTFMPLQVNGAAMTIAINNPFNFSLFDELRLVLNKELDFVLATEEEISKSIKQFYGIGAEAVEKMIAESDKEIEILSEQRKDEDIEDEAVDASVIKFVNQILLEAIRDGATDIHLEPFEDSFRIRYRIDGLLYEAAIPPSIRHFQSALVSRIKIMANLNIAEKRLPQDGRIKIKTGKEEFDLRVSILPTSFGEGVNIRILTRKSIFLGLEQLGFLPESLNKMLELIKKPHGIILVTGPTGSGKTTTLYACLSRINAVERKILTIEDPIEYQLKGALQMQIAPKINFTFANALRSMLRHDPDIMMVGEIRDLETAEITIRTALTGHLVFSTLHTNDAAGAVTRLLDMGIEPYLVSSSVEGLIAQRLVRLICPHCKEKFTPEKEALQEVGTNTDEIKKVTFYRGKGCPECRHTGYRGRTGIYEIILLNEELKELILQRVPASKIKHKAQKMGMKTLREDGWEKIKRGLTTIEEVLRVTQEDEFSKTNP